MLSLRTVELVEGVLAGGVSQRQTAIRTGVARGTVSRIASGYWRKQFLQRKLRLMERETARSRVAKRRCSVCGALLVEIPCRACRVRRLLAAGRLVRNFGRPEGGEPLAVQIEDPEERRRYEELHRRKRRECSGGGDGEAVWDAGEGSAECGVGSAEDSDPNNMELASIDEELSCRLSVHLP